MAWDLWSLSYGQVVSGRNYWSQHPEFDFYFGCGCDVIEEDALNMESCLRVLRILITKADTEIEELERDLLLLQNELACAEHEKWPDICRGGLTERIKRLDVVSLDVNILSPNVKVTEHALDKDSSKIDSNIFVKGEEKDLLGTSESSGSLELLLEPHEKRSDKSDNPEKIEDLSRSSDLGAIICVPYHSDEMTLSEISDDKFTGNEKVGISQHVNTDIGQMLDSFSAKENGNIPSEAKKENEIVKEKDVSSDDFRPATDVKGRKKCSHSRLATSQRNSRNSNLDKKLFDFAPKTARRAYKKEPKLAPDEDLNSLDLPLQIVYPRTLCITDSEFCSFEGSNGNNSKLVFHFENTTPLIKAENSELISLLGMQNESALYTGLQLIHEDEEKHEAQDLKSQITASLRKSNMSCPSNLKAREKQKLELEAISSGETYDSCTKVISTTSIIVSTKRQRRSIPCTDVATLNEPMNRKIITRRAVQPDKHDPEGRAIVLYDSKFSELQKKRKVLKLPISVDMQNSTVEMDVANSDRGSMDKGSQLILHSSESHSLVDSLNGTSPLLPGPLDNLTLTDLRALAKEHNVRKYYKLRKGALVEQLSLRLRSC